MILIANVMLTKYSLGIQIIKFCYFLELNPTQKPVMKNRTPGLHSSRYGTSKILPYPKSFKIQRRRKLGLYKEV